jgi:hypothetical protein
VLESSPCRTRVTQALAGEVVEPPVVGLTFIDPEVLKSVYRGAGSVGSTMASMAVDNDLDFVFIPASAVWALETVAALSTSDTCLFWVVDGPLNTVVKKRGFQDMIKASLRDPDDLAQDLEQAAADIRPMVREGLQVGAAAIVVADDLASPAGPFTAPDFMISEVIPRLAATVADAMGEVPVIVHSDGDIGAFLRPIAQAGFDGVHMGGMGQDVFSRLLTNARRSSISVIGGLEGADLRRGLPQAVRAGVHASLRAQTGGLLIADDGGMSTTTELSAFVTAVQSVRAGAPRIGSDD